MYYYEIYYKLLDVAKTCETMDDFWEYIGGNGLEQDVLLNMGLMTQEQIDSLDELNGSQMFVSDAFFEGIFLYAHKEVEQ